MTVIRPNTLIGNRLTQNQQDLRTLDKAHSARIQDLRTQQKATAQQTAAVAAQAAATAEVANASSVTTETVQVSSGIIGPNGQPLYGWSGGASMFPLSNDGNTGSSWATGERGFINNLNAAVNFIWQVLLDNGIVT